MVRILALLLVAAFPAIAQETRARLSIEFGGDAPPVVGEMIPVIVKGEYGLSITLESLDIPQSPDFDWVQLARDSWTRERVEGVELLVMRRYLALYPKHEGALTFGPLTHELTIQAGGTRSEIEVTAPAVTLEVAPYPADVGWPLSAAALELTDELSSDPARLRDGETITRTVTLRTLGPLPQMLPVRPRMREPWLITFAAPEKREMVPTPDGPISTVTWVWQLRPKTGEPGVVPAVDFPWFDTEAREMRLARLDPVPIGYQSFGANARMMTRLPTWAALQLWGAGLLGAILAFLSLSVGLRPVGVVRLATSWKVLVRRAVLRIRIAGAARRGDLAGLRRHAAAYLRTSMAPDPTAQLNQLDRVLFAPDTARPDLDTRAFARRVLSG